MKTKNFLVSGIVGGIVFFFLGFLFYVVLFKDFFPPHPEEGSENVAMIFLGCLTLGFFVSLIFTKWAMITAAAAGAKAGAVIGLFLGLYWNFFYIAFNPSYPYSAFALDVAIAIVTIGITGAVVALVNGKMSPTPSD